MHNEMLVLQIRPPPQRKKLELVLKKKVLESFVNSWHNIIAHLRNKPQENSLNRKTAKKARKKKN